ncbi:MAG: ABC transporter ATP-binding protein [Candidatus Rokubacteria bacterium]|nr:ABC transporter ATP-binding protein [Candidatus Rokubacteria bacterium]
MTPDAIVTFRDVRFAYPAAERRGAQPFAVDALDFDVRRGEILGVIGPNSAGKTTLVRLLTRVVTPDAGAIVLDGAPLAGIGARDLARRVAVVPQELPQGFPFTVEQLVLMGRYPHGPGRFFETDADRGIAREAMAAVGVLDLAAAPLDQLSGGERQRAVLARALAQRPRLLVLDEPTAHLDLRYQAACGALLRRLSAEDGVTVLLVSHDLNLAAELADRLLLLAGGRLVALGAPEDVLDAERLEQVFGARVVVEKSAVTKRPFVQLTWEAQERR